MNKTITKFISSLIYILLGLALVIEPALVNDLLCYLLAGATIIFGLIRIVGYLMTKVEERLYEDTNGLAIGLAFIILGVFILMKGTMFVMLFPFVLGFMITYKGLEGLQNVVNLKKFGYPVPMVTLMIAGVVLVFGLIVMINPFATAMVLFRMLGFGLIVGGVADMVMDIIFTRKIKVAKARATAPMEEPKKETAESTEV